METVSISSAVVVAKVSSCIDFTVCSSPLPSDCLSRKATENILAS